MTASEAVLSKLRASRVAERISSVVVGDIDGERPSPALVSFSWDDGHVLDLKLADLLDIYGVKATFYVCPPAQAGEGANLAGDKLSGPQLRALSERFEIGAHTVTHPLLTTVDDDRARDEICLSKVQLEDVLGDSVISFCYPGGRRLPQHVAMVEQAGFKLARTIRRYTTVLPRTSTRRPRRCRRTGTSTTHPAWRRPAGRARCGCPVGCATGTTWRSTCSS